MMVDINNSASRPNVVALAFMYSSVALLQCGETQGFSLLIKPTSNGQRQQKQHVLTKPSTPHSSTRSASSLWLNNNNNNHDDDDPLEYDDDDFFFEDEDSELIFSATQNQQKKDFSGCSIRQFNLGFDIILSDYIGSMGFEEVTDWEYYQSQPSASPSSPYNDSTRKVVDPPPFDPNAPKRTREKSGSVVRIFRGELSGRIGSAVRSIGLDNRVMLKEFTGDRALALAKAELESLTKMQSQLCSVLDDGARNGEWYSSASSRYLNGRVNSATKEDDDNLMKWMQIVNKSKDTPYIATYGELNLSEFFNDEGNARNDWYRSLGVTPPKPTSLWLIYEYAGLSTIGRYAVPPLKRWSTLPYGKGIFGKAIPPPPLPPFRERAKYVKSIMKKSLEGIATLHDNGITHRSIGRNSIIISSVGQDKQEASSVFATVTPRLLIKFADFGFAGEIIDSSRDADFRKRAKAFKLELQEGLSSIESKSFAVAEDLHALGFVFVALLLTSLAEVPKADHVLPPTDEDALQRLMSDIFDKDMQEFREYCDAEEIWSSVVDLLDENNGAGWDVLENMCFARESVKENIDSGRILDAQGLLSSTFFK